MLLWGLVAAIVQAVVFFVISRLLFKAISQRIAERCIASGIFVGGMGLGFGVLQAACMVEVEMRQHDVPHVARGEAEALHLF